MEGRWPNYAVPPKSAPDFERYVATIFGDRGYDVLLPPPSNDFGADLLLVKLRNDEKSIVVIRFLDGGLVGSEAVQQAASAMLAWGVKRGWVVTNAVGFSENAKKLATSDNVCLVNGEELSELVVQILGGDPSAQSSDSATASAARTSIPLGAPTAAGAISAAAPAVAATGVPSQPLVPTDPFAPSASAPVAGMPSAGYPGLPSASYPGSQTADYAGTPMADYPAMPGSPGQPAYMPPYPQYPELPKERHLGWLISILATIAIILVILALYIFIAPSIFDAIEADNPGLHIVRWEEVIDAITSS